MWDRMLNMKELFFQPKRNWLFVSWFATSHKAAGMKWFEFQIFFFFFFSLPRSFPFRRLLIKHGTALAVDGNERSMIDARYWFGSSLIATAPRHAPKLICSPVNQSLKVTQKIKANEQNKVKVIQFNIALNYSRTVGYITRKLSIVFKGFLSLSFVSSFFPNSDFPGAWTEKGAPRLQFPVAKKYK